MKRIVTIRYGLLMLLVVAALGVRAQHNLDSLYRCLDNEIERFPEYVAVHDREVALLTEELRQAKDDALRYDLNYRLYDKYRPFINDSAIYYLRNCIELAEKLHQPARVNECRSLLALRCSNTGMYDEALEMINQVEPALLDTAGLGIYYEARNHVYNELAYYTHLDDMKEKYLNEAKKYEDLMLSILPDTSDAAFLRREMIDLNSGRIQQSMSTNNEWGVEDAFYTSQLAPALESLAGARGGETYTNTPEYDDLNLFLSVCEACGISPMVVIQPSLGPYYDHIGISQQTRADAYEHIRSVVASHPTARLADFSNREYERYFMFDIVHFGWTGWIEAQKALYDFATEGA